MLYFIAFLEGIITFISPCLLPMLPVYISYFAGTEEKNTKKTLLNAIGFVCGFTIVFVLMGAMAGIIGGFFIKHRIIVNIITGLIVILFGLYFLGIIKINIFKGMKTSIKENMGFFSSLLFGAVFSISWTPCVGAFLGSALALASSEGSVLKGVIMLLLYSMGLGIPFVVTAILIEKLKSAFDFIKKNYKIINIVSGIFLILTGVLMATGLFSKLTILLS